VLLRGPATAKVTWDGCSTLEVDPAGGGGNPRLGSVRLRILVEPPTLGGPVLFVPEVLGRLLLRRGLEDVSW